MRARGSWTKALAWALALGPGGAKAEECQCDNQGVMVVGLQPVVLIVDGSVKETTTMAQTW